jgi:hypothetical protein
LHIYIYIYACVCHYVITDIARYKERYESNNVIFGCVSKWQIPQYMTILTGIIILYEKP